METHQEICHLFGIFVARIMDCSNQSLEDGKEWVPILSHDGPTLYQEIFMHSPSETPWLLHEICPPTAVSRILVTKNAVGGLLFFFRFLHCWMKSSIHHQAPKTLQFQSPASNA